VPKSNNYKYAAPIGARNVGGFGFYKDVAPHGAGCDALFAGAALQKKGVFGSLQKKYFLTSQK
jgi:hypothetical protein